MSGSTLTLDLIREVGQDTFKRVFTKRISFNQWIAKNRYDFLRRIIEDPTLKFFFDALQSRLSADYQPFLQKHEGSRIYAGACYELMP